MVVLRWRAAVMRTMAAKKQAEAAKQKGAHDKSKAGAAMKQAGDEKQGPAAALMRGYDKMLSSEILKQNAAESEAVAKQNEDILENGTSDLTAKLGEILEQKFEEGNEEQGLFPAARPQRRWKRIEDGMAPMHA